ncbi:MAG: energy transducer TonB [Fibrobacter sp.]|nr:energy transducer TonB [Fibrobacter sp.]
MKILTAARFPAVLVLAFLVNAAFFLAVPVVNALFFSQKTEKKTVTVELTETEVVVQEKKQEQPQKVIRQISQPNRFRANQSMGNTRSRGFQMDLSLARGDFGDGVAVGGGGLENVIYDVGEVDEDARVLKEVNPNYPDRAKKMGVSGYVKIYLVIDVYGNISQAEVIQVDPPGYGFETEALAAIRQWKFEPAKLGNLPVAQKATKEFRFVQ